MGKYKGFKNRLEKFFSSEDGQRVFNFAYSFGAAIVIIGALFKLLHLPFADLMLCIGMGSEAFIFALSAFDKPAKNYKWEEVFPVLESGDEADRPNLSGMGQASFSAPAAGGYQPSGAATFQNQAPSGSYGNVPSQSFDSPVNTPELANATQRYAEQLSEMTAQLEHLRMVTGALSDVQTTLLNSYSSISGSSDSLSANSHNYVQQMEALNRNISGLNTIYEIQLKSVSSQLDTIDKVNSGLNNVRTLYDNSAMDSFRIRQETEKMTENLANLNKVYERMLQAMTASMHGSNAIR